MASRKGEASTSPAGGALRQAAPSAGASGRQEKGETPRRGAAPPAPAAAPGPGLELAEPRAEAEPQQQQQQQQRGARARRAPAAGEGRAGWEGRASPTRGPRPAAPRGDAAARPEAAGRRAGGRAGDGTKAPLWRGGRPRVTHNGGGSRRRGGRRRAPGRPAHVGPRAHTHSRDVSASSGGCGACGPPPEPAPVSDCAGGSGVSEALALPQSPPCNPDPRERAGPPALRPPPRHRLAPRAPPPPPGPAPRACTRRNFQRPGLGSARLGGGPAGGGGGRPGPWGALCLQAGPEAELPGPLGAPARSTQGPSHLGALPEHLLGARQWAIRKTLTFASFRELDRSGKAGPQDGATEVQGERFRGEALRSFVPPPPSPPAVRWKGFLERKLRVAGQLEQEADGHAEMQGRDQGEQDQGTEGANLKSRPRKRAFGVHPEAAQNWQPTSEKSVLKALWRVWPLSDDPVSASSASQH
ncbi:uncharacterized protein LOC142426755 [Tenrec ecaudatus]|uniref:uncharacterized protein LOC142426755 n=1 Tax=Tenrec ecaudatus TaxID=94439 RepID=UPI003F5953EB